MGIDKLVHLANLTRAKVDGVAIDRARLNRMAVAMYEAKEATVPEIAGALGVSTQRFWQILRQVRDARQDA